MIRCAVWPAASHWSSRYAICPPQRDNSPAARNCLITRWIARAVACQETGPPDCQGVVNSSLPQQLLPRRTMTIRPGRTHRVGDRPDQPVIDSADIVVAGQTGCLRGPPRSAAPSCGPYRNARRSCGTQGRQPGHPSQTRSTSLILFILTSRKAMPAASRDLSCHDDRTNKRKDHRRGAPWSRDWQSRWSCPPLAQADHTGPKLMAGGILDQLAVIYHPARRQLNTRI